MTSEEQLLLLNLYESFTLIDPFISRWTVNSVGDARRLRLKPYRQLNSRAAPRLRHHSFPFFVTDRHRICRCDGTLALALLLPSWGRWLILFNIAVTGFRISNSLSRSHLNFSPSRHRHPWVPRRGSSLPETLFCLL